MGDDRRPFDIKPTVFIAAFSVLLAGTLIAVNTRLAGDEVETAAIRALDDGAERIAARQVGVQSPSRQIVSPALSADAFALVAEEVVVEVAGETESIDDPGPDTDEPANDVAVESASTPDVPLTTSSLTTTTAPRSPPATTTTSTTVAPTTTRTRVTTTTRPRATTTSVRSTTTTVRPTTTARPTTTTTRPATTTTRPQTTTTTRAPVNGRYSVAQVIDGTIGAGDGANPNEESPMGRHDASLYLPQGWNWAQGPTRNSAWGQLGTGQFQRAEYRCAVIPENGHNPPVPFRINIRNGAYYQYANGSWKKAFDLVLDGTDHGAYLGRAGTLNTDPFSNGGPGAIQWRREADGSYSAPWNSAGLMMHFWAGQRRLPASGQIAEFAHAEVRLQQPDGQNVDLSRVKVLFQCGVDYYSSSGGQGTKVPGPGIAKYHRATTSWRPTLWVTLPKNVPAASTSDFRNWLVQNLPPDVRP